MTRDPERGYGVLPEPAPNDNWWNRLLSAIFSAIKFVLAARLVRVLLAEFIFIATMLGILLLSRPRLCHLLCSGVPR